MLTQKALESVWDSPHEIFRVRGVKDAFEILKKVRADVVLLDLNVTDSDGLNTVDAFTKDPDRPYVIVVTTSLKEKKMAISALERGAQDYVIKGKFSPEDLGRSIEFALARSPKSRSKKTEKVRLDFDRFRFISEISGAAIEIELTATEMKVMALLMKNMGEPVSRKDLVAHVAGANIFTTDRSTANQMSRLRAKLPGTGVDIKSVRGVGYKLLYSNSKA